MTNIQKEIGARLRNLRDGKGLKQKNLSDVLGITPAAYGKFESGERGLSSEYCIALADFFGVSCDYILRGIDSQNIDICTKTAIDQQTLDVLIENKRAEYTAFAFYKKHQEDEDTLVLLDENDQYEILHELSAEDEEKQEDIEVHYAHIRDYSISNSLLNYFIRDKELWEELRRASYQYVTCLEEIIECNKEYKGRPSVEEGLNQMGLDAAKYIAGQAFGVFFSKTMENVSFIQGVSRLGNEEVEELIKLKFVKKKDK